MGNKSTKPELTADEQWLEKKCPGAGKISANRWRNPKKTNCTAWEGNCSPGQIQQLSKCLHAEIEKTSGKKKVLRMFEYVNFFVPWQEESKKREEKRNKKQNKQSKKPPTETTNPPLYQTPPSAPGPPDTEQPYPPNPHPPVSKNPFVKPQDPYVSARQQLDLMTHEDPPPWPPGPLGQFPLIQAPNPNFGRITGEPPQTPGGALPRDRHPFTYTFLPWSAEDRKNVLKDVPPLNEGHQQWRDAVELIRSSWMLNGLLPSIRAHVEKHWVTMNTGNLADALQYAEHATRVLKKKEKGGVFTVDPETGFIAFAGGYQGPRRGQGQKNNRGRKRNAGYKGDRRDREDRDNRCYNCGKEGHFARGCRYKNDNQDKWLPREEGETEIFNIEQLPLGSEHKPTAIIHVNGQPMTMLCDTGACKTVLNKKPKNLKHSNDTLIVKSASGHTSVKSLTESLTLEHKDSGRSCKNQCIYDPSCPVNLLGRDALEKLKIGVVPGPEGMYAKTMLCEGLDPQVNELVVHEGEGVPSHYWTLDLPPLEPLQNIANRYLPGHSRKLNFSEYHNTLRFKQSPGPDRSYDQQVHRLGPQKTHPATSVLENKEIVLSNQLPRDSLPVSSRSCSQHPQHAGLLNDPRGFIKATQRRLNQSKTHQHLLKVSDKFRLWSSPTSSVRSVGGRVISGNTRDPTPLAEVYSLEATGVSGGREEENTHRNGDARQRTQDSTEGERRDGHRRRQYWTTGCQLTTVTTLCFMFVFSVFLTIAIVSMNMASTDNPCDPHCQQIYRQYPSVTCSEQSAVPKQDHRTTEKVELTRKKRSFCRGYCYGVAGARKYDNPCNQTATLKKTEDLYLCYHKTSFFSAVWIPLNSFHIGGYRGDKWNEYDWYLSSTDWDQG
ncbi:uncharacterized protein LOC109197025 [Oreochromis niloticus]|uniref:uncharacterized protein LOC109197025 n=1 Tax=Oreochromis niloticus TaxID=8128 RepID=UPI000905CA6D|nr:uncharacterized protein LOC109197025 [Oreochromis niloticus]